MENLALIGTVIVVHFLALVSPGPDFIMTVRNSLSYSRKTGVYTAVGLACGICVHVIYSLAGIALLISKSIILFNFLKFLGAGYLVYIGLKSLSSKTEQIDTSHSKKTDISPFSAIRIGFLTNVFNPKATLYFLSLFTLVISPDTPALTMSIISFFLITMTGLWFSTVAIFLTQQKIRKIFEKFQNAFNKTFGGILIALGIKVALSEK